ncbi:MAG TPA: hypothetical protein VIP08_07175, partial [Phenylobacterium sp.]|uniref:hypothetical protein n=1 Tax=Phenylobacterium sp. TaxID=1871053 RepID=UPI002F94158F
YAIFSIIALYVGINIKSDYVVFSIKRRMSTCPKSSCGFRTEQDGWLAAGLSNRAGWNLVAQPTRLQVAEWPKPLANLK